MPDSLEGLRADLDKTRADFARAVAWMAAWRVLREAEIARYRAALEPFRAAYLASLPVEAGGTGAMGPLVTLADCARAALALEGES